MQVTTLHAISTELMMALVAAFTAFTTIFVQYLVQKKKTQSEDTVTLIEAHERMAKQHTEEIRSLWDKIKELEVVHRDCQENERKLSRRIWELEKKVSDLEKEKEFVGKKNVA